MWPLAFDPNRKTVSNAPAKPIPPLTKDDFAEKVLEAKGEVAIEATSPYCGPCRRAAPMIDDVAQALGSKVQIYKLDVVAEPELASTLGITSIPSMVMFRNGNQIGRASIQPSPSAIRKAIDSAFGWR